MRTKFFEISPRRDAVIDGSWRIQPYATSISVLKSNKLFHKLFPYNHSGYGMYGPKEELRKVFRRFNPYSRPDSEGAINLRIFEYDKTIVNFLAHFDDGGSIGVYSGRNFDECLSSLEKYFHKVSEKTDLAELYRPLNKKFDVVAVFISGHELVEPDIIRRVQHLQAHAEKLRIQILFMAEEPTLIPVEIEDNLSWQLFISREMITYAKDAYELQCAFVSDAKIEHAVVLDKINFPEYLLSLQDLLGDDTAYFKKLKDSKKDEIDNYMEYLNSLSAG